MQTRAGQSGGNPGEAESGFVARKLPGIVLDDTQAEKTGEWMSGNARSPCRRQLRARRKREQGSACSPSGTWKCPRAANYELVLHYPPNANRATNVPVTVVNAGQTAELKVNEKEKGGEAKLGRFKLTKGQKATVTIGNADTDGHVIVDGLQLVPAKIERRACARAQNAEIDLTLVRRVFATLGPGWSQAVPGGLLARKTYSRSSQVK
jgi:hypothetical protein